MGTKLNYRLALDLGTNSLGWCTIGLDAHGVPSHVHDAGVRIFQSGRDEQTKQSLAEGRRLARGTRRRRDRYIRRRDQLRHWLATCGLMPLDPTERQTVARLDPYRLRYEGLDRPLLPYELGRVLFALNQRRGFKSGRKTESPEDKSAIKEAQALEDAIAQVSCRSLGDYLWQYHQTQNKEELEAGIARVQNVRARPGSIGLYPLRKMYEDSILSGEINNANSNNLIFNYLNT